MDSVELVGSALHRGSARTLAYVVRHPFADVREVLLQAIDDAAEIVKCGAVTVQSIQRSQGRIVLLGPMNRSILNAESGSSAHSSGAGLRYGCPIRFFLANRRVVQLPHPSRRVFVTRGVEEKCVASRGTQSVG